MPGNLAELRPLIFVAAFVGFIVLMFGIMVAESPSLFMGATTGSSSITNSTTSPNPLNLLAWNSTYILNITDSSDASYHFVIQGWNVAVFTYDQWGIKKIDMATYSEWWIFKWDWDDFAWYKDGVQVSEQGEIWFNLYVLDTHYSQNKTLNYLAKNTKTQLTVYFVFNTTAYAKPTDAYSAGGLAMVFQQDFNDRNTSVNALSFLAGLFTFSLPGMPWQINMLIWIAIFPALMYLAFIFVLKILGAIFGGG
jgi:hypothetical protein